MALGVATSDCATRSIRAILGSDQSTAALVFGTRKDHPSIGRKLAIRIGTQNALSLSRFIAHSYDTDHISFTRSMISPPEVGV